MAQAIKIINVPGLYGSGTAHWQTLWEQRDSTIGRVDQEDWYKANPDNWIQNLDRCVADSDAPVVLTGHSMSCAVIAHWARLGRPGVVGAMLVAPSDVDDPAYSPDSVRGFAPIPLERLPFDTIVVSSDDDPHVSPQRAGQFATAWGAELISVGAKGHINIDSDIGDWPEGFAILQRLIERVSASVLSTA